MKIGIHYDLENLRSHSGAFSSDKVGVVLINTLSKAWMHRGTRQIEPEEVGVFRAVRSAGVCPGGGVVLAF